MTMKKLLALVVVFIAVIGNSCKKDSTNLSETYISEPVPGAWRISSFSKDSVEIANQFAGYTFDCNVNGAMTIQYYAHTYNYRWSFIDDNHSRVHFYIMGCDGNSVLKELDKDWFITSRDANYCYFSNRNPEHPRIMTLHRV